MRAPTTLVLTDNDFLDRFQPIKNHTDQHAGFDGCLFETYGAELAFVQAQDPAKIWTVLGCDGNLVIAEVGRTLLEPMSPAPSPSRRTYRSLGDVCSVPGSWC